MTSNGDEPIASVGQRYWDPETKIGSKSNNPEIERGGSWQWEIIFAAVKFDELYKRKGLASELLQRTEQRCLDISRRDGHTGPVRCVARCAKEFNLKYYEGRGYNFVSEEYITAPGTDEAPLKAMAEKFVSEN